MAKLTSLALSLLMVSMVTEARHKPLPTGFFHHFPLGHLFSGHEAGSHGDGSHGSGSGMTSGDGDGFTSGGGIMSGDGNHDNSHIDGSDYLSGDGFHGGSGIISGDGDYGNGQPDGSGFISGDHDNGFTGNMSGDHDNGFTGGMSGDHDNGFSGDMSSDHDNGFTGGMSSDHDNGFNGDMSGDHDNGFTGGIGMSSGDGFQSGPAGSHGDNMQAVSGIIGVIGDLHEHGEHNYGYGQVSGDDDDDDDDFDSDFGQPHKPQPDCGNSCAKCDMFGLCRRCKQGYKVDQWGIGCIKKPKPAKKSCRFVSNCQECPGASLFYRPCQRCRKGWFKFQGMFPFTSKCVKKCPRNYQGKTTMAGPICEKIKPKCPLIRGCVKCTTRTKCIQCSKNLSVSNNWYGRSRCVRKCPQGYQSIVKDGARVCQLEEGCRDRYCSFCKKGWFEILGSFSGRKCHKKCPRGFYQIDNNSCLQCERGCEQCSSPTGQCTSCKGNLALYKTDSPISRTTCRARCPRGYTKTLLKGKGFVCEKACYVANCQSCPIDDHIGQYHHCDSCKPGFHLLHQIFDRCVRRCPKGHYIEKTFIGTICRKGIRPTAEQTTAEPTTVQRQTATELEQTTTEPEQTTTQYEQTTPEPEQTTTEHEKTTTKPEQTSTETEKTTTKPEQTTTEPEKMTTGTEKLTVEPYTSGWVAADSAIVPEATASEPDKTTLEPSFTYNDEP